MLYHFKNGHMLRNAHTHIHATRNKTIDYIAMYKFSNHILMLDLLWRQSYQVTDMSLTVYNTMYNNVYNTFVYNIIYI